MACTGKPKLRKDIEYVKFMANLFSKNTGKIMGIYGKWMEGIGRYYDFEEIQEGKEYIEVIRFDNDIASKVILSNNEGERLELADNIGADEPRESISDMDGYSGGLLQKEQSDTVSDRPKKSHKDRKPKK